MTEALEHSLPGIRGTLVVREWPHPAPHHIVILVHGYGEHMGRYEYVATALVRHGAAVYGPDHMGHGRSAGERVLIDDFDEVVTDVRTVERLAREAHPDVPVVVVGHSMGGLIAARHAQRYGDGLAALVLSGPVLGHWRVVDSLLPLEELPDTPIDPATLSRDPEVGEAYAADPLVWHGPFKRRTLRALDRGMRTINEGKDLGALPILWMHGGDDRIVPIDGTRSGIDRLRGNDFTERVRPGAQHEIFNETDKDETLAEVTAFLDRALAG